jgi:hypothetical protein
MTLESFIPTINNCPPHADGSRSPACGLWDVERQQSAASKTEEATNLSESWTTTSFRRRIFDRSGVKARTNHAVGHILPCWDVETRVVHIMAQHTLCAKPSERGNRHYRIRRHCTRPSRRATTLQEYHYRLTRP